MNNVAFWEIKNHFLLHRRHVSATEPNRLMLFKISYFHGINYEESRLLVYISPVRTSLEALTSRLQSPAAKFYVKFEVFTVITKKNAVFQDVTPYDMLRRLLFTFTLVPSSPILVTLMMEALHSLKRRFLQEPHGVTSQKTAFFIVTAVKTQILQSVTLFIPRCQSSGLCTSCDRRRTQNKRRHNPEKSSYPNPLTPD
jgi:hypothetical protein